MLHEKITFTEFRYNTFNLFITHLLIVVTCIALTENNYKYVSFTLYI